PRATARGPWIRPRSRLPAADARWRHRRPAGAGPCTMDRRARVRCGRPAAGRGGDVNPHMIDDEKALDRVVFFSDAIFAIAMTLLVLQLRIPFVPSGNEHLLWHRLGDQLPSFYSFALSFFTIGLQWMAHQRKFRLIRRYDSVLLWINLMFLFCIAFLPFPTAVLGRIGGQASAVFYACSIAATRLLGRFLAVHAA